MAMLTHDVRLCTHSPRSCCACALELRRVGGDAFAALVSKCNEPRMQSFSSQCKYCGITQPFDDSPHTSVGQCGAPAFISLELPSDAPRSLRYDLRPNGDLQLMRR